MKEYCVDLELAKELQENGFPQETYFYWYDVKNEKFEDEFVNMPILANKRYTPVYDGESNRYWKQCNALAEKYKYSAPTSDEILKELPKYIKKDIVYDLTIKNYPVASVILYQAYGVKELPYCKLQEDEKLSNALAKMWLYLKKEGYIK